MLNSFWNGMVFVFHQTLTLCEGVGSARLNASLLCIYILSPHLLIWGEECKSLLHAGVSTTEYPLLHSGIDVHELDTHPRLHGPPQEEEQCIINKIDLTEIKGRVHWGRLL